MNAQKIDLLNIGLILVSFLGACLLPFELFLFVYAVLGPLHYLTEIHWLREKSYFVRDKRWTWVLIALAFVAATSQLAYLPFFQAWIVKLSLQKIFQFLSVSVSRILLISLLFSIALVYAKNWLYLLASLFLSVVATLLLFHYVSFSVLLVGAFLPTLIHVYVFTLLFMIQGTLKTKGWAGILAIISLILVPVFIVFMEIDATDYLVVKSVENTYIASGFQRLGAYIAQTLNLLQNGQFVIFSNEGIKIQIFLAFSYTYHYLNWFSKTTVIKWNQALSKKKIAIILLVWLISVLLYRYDYRTGLISLFFLSFLHVLLEFPLNIQSMRMIGNALFSSKQSASK